MGNFNLVLRALLLLVGLSACSNTSKPSQKSGSEEKPVPSIIDAQVLASDASATIARTVHAQLRVLGMT